MTTIPARPASRFTFIDALRGLAALWVAGHHFYPGISNHYQTQPLPEPLHSLMHLGNAGVEVFFVLSGFVIAYTVRAAKITPGYFGNFVFRRSLRLEPPYWATIALAITAAYVSNLIRHDRIAPLPSWQQLLAHVFYLQDVLRYGNILTVFWTLCYEVQFYISFILLLGVAQWISDRWHLTDGGRSCVRLILFAPLTVYSLGIQAGLLTCPHAFMVRSWSLFFLGVLAWWALSGQIKGRTFWAYVAVLAALLVQQFSARPAIGLLTGVSIFAVGAGNRLDTWLNLAPLQYLGRISYSLYLIHTVIGDPIVYYFRNQLVGGTPSAPVGIAFFAVACGVSIAGAHLMYRFIEQPSVEFAKRFKQREPLAAKTA